MQKTMKMALAVAIACGGIGLTTQSIYAADQNNDENTSQNDQTARMAPTLPPGLRVVKNTKTEDMTETLESATENAVKAGEFDDVVSKLVDQDRDRIGDFKDKKFADLDAQADKFQKAWKDKYGHDFDIDRARTFSNVIAAEGEIQDPKKVLTDWPVNAETGAGRHAEAQPKEPLNEETKEQGNIDKGTEIGVVHLPKAGNTPDLYASMLDEAGGWKIDVPNNRSGQQIHDDLLKNLTRLNDNQKDWPSDETEASRVVVNCVISALYGVGK
jgi:hypothetical protein